MMTYWPQAAIIPRFSELSRTAPSPKLRTRLSAPAAIAPIATTSEEQKDDDNNENEFHWILQTRDGCVPFSHHFDFETGTSE